MNSLASAISLAATLATTHAALAQHTRVLCEVSDNYGSTWRDTLSVWPGQRVDVRVRFELVDVPAGLTVLGFAGATYQPTLTNWRPVLGDTRSLFSFPGLDQGCGPTFETAYDGRHIRDFPGMTGRVAPFGPGGQGAGSSCGVLTHFVDPTNALRFAGSKNTTPNTNPAWGVASAQQPQNLAQTNFVASLNVAVFKYAVTLAPRTTAPRQLVASVPRQWISGGITKWYLNALGTSVLNLSVRDEDIVPATILVHERCPGDLIGGTFPNPSGPGSPNIPGPDGSVNIDDLLYFIVEFRAGRLAADLDDGSGEGVQDQAVTIEDLLFFLVHFEQGC